MDYLVLEGVRVELLVLDGVRVSLYCRVEGWNCLPREGGGG